MAPYTLSGIMKVSRSQFLFTLLMCGELQMGQVLPSSPIGFIFILDRFVPFIIAVITVDFFFFFFALESFLIEFCLSSLFSFTSQSFGHNFPKTSSVLL